MEAFLIYILKSSACTVIFYLFYRLLLSRETFYRFNRIALLCILLLSAIIPFCEITVFVPQQTGVQQAVPAILNQLLPDAGYAETSLQEEQTWMPPAGVLLAIYWVGFALFACRSLYSFLNMQLLLRKGERKPGGKRTVLIVHNEEKTGPFSWMKYIVISRKDLEESGKEILIHEQAHVYNWHSTDLLIADICIFFQWFNPAIWLMKQELQNVHEYEADEAVINQGIDAKKYQLLLIKKAVGTRLYSVANSFNHSKLKKRITMMLKEKSSSRACWKYLYILPVAVIAMSVFARSEALYELNETSGFKVNDSIPIIGKEIGENQSIEKDTSTNRIRVSKISMKMNPTKSNTIIIEENNGDTISKKPLIIVDGQEISYPLMSAIDPRFIESISVLKDESATALYGEKGANGVILITLKSEEEQKKIGQIPPSPDFVYSNEDVSAQKQHSHEIIHRGKIIQISNDSILGNGVIRVHRDSIPKNSIMPGGKTKTKIKIINKKKE
jgi:TonB-dependent SusC/RagA subfamily outer membrane receptor